jgi:hypothetical protein
MALRIIYLLLGAAIAINLVLICVGLIMGVNLYKTYGKQILNFCLVFAIFVVAVYTVLAIIGLI